MGKAGQSAQGEAGHCDVNPGFGGFTQCFVVLAQPPLQVQPAEGALHDPPPGQDLKGCCCAGRRTNSRVQPPTVLAHSTNLPP